MRNERRLQLTKPQLEYARRNVGIVDAVQLVLTWEKRSDSAGRQGETSDMTGPARPTSIDPVFEHRDAVHVTRNPEDTFGRDPTQREYGIGQEREHNRHPVGAVELGLDRHCLLDRRAKDGRVKGGAHRALNLQDRWCLALGRLVGAQSIETVCQASATVSQNILSARGKGKVVN